MTTPATNAALKLRLNELAARNGRQFNLEAFCHEKQLSAIRDPFPFSTWVTSRRSGKTTGCAADLIDTCLRERGKTCLYITLTRSNAKKLLWPILQQINRDFHLGAVPNITDLSVEFPNHSLIYLAGANDSQSIQNFRGMKLKKVYLDEPQSMRSYIKELVDEIISPALIDEAGQLRLIGTPGAVPVGYFHETATSPRWSHHFWTVFENPFIQANSGLTAQALLERELERRGVSIDDPVIQREWFGKWMIDLNSLVIRYQAEKNHFDDLPDGHKWENIIAVDVGYEDADAIAVIGFSETLPTAYLREEIVKNKQGVTELAVSLEKLISVYQPLKVVMDTGGLGKKVAEEIRRRYGLPIYPADKQRKIEYIELLNDALRTGRFMAKKDSRFAEDAMLLEWDRENPERPKISDRFHSDVVDAVLYGFRESLHFLYEPRKQQPRPGTSEWYDNEEKRMWEEVESRQQQEKDEEGFWSDPFDS